MENKWKVTHNHFGSVDMYRVYRVLDPKEPDHSGNREFKGGIVYNEKEAEDMAAQFNLEEAFKK